MAASKVQVLLGRRPPKKGASAFGHVDVSQAGRQQLQEIVKRLEGWVKAQKPIAFHPDDEADSGEVLWANLAGVDKWFQPNADWSLERVVAAFSTGAFPTTLSGTEIEKGDWSFYAVQGRVGSTNVVAIRAKSPTYGLAGPNKLVTAFVGNELKPVKDPLISFDHSADVVVVGKRAFILNPRTVERLFVDADAVKKRANATASSFDAQLGATLNAATKAAVERVCSNNANIARRVERLNRDGTLAKVSAAKLRAALPDAGLASTDFGQSGAISAGTDIHATVLVDLAADLYYQPRFESRPRRVASYRKLK